MIVNLSASNEITGKSRYRRELVSGQSARLVCAYLYASAGGSESTQDVVYSGHNILAENGNLLAESNVFSEGMTKSCPTLSDPMNCSPLGSSVHGVLQARMLEWVAISFYNRDLGKLIIF